VRFLIDASLPESITEILRDHGHFGIHASAVGLGSAPDERIADYARANGHAILAADFDFADIRKYPPQDYEGIAVLTLPRRRDMLLIALLVRELLASDVSQDMKGKLVIVEVGRIRVRT